MAVRDELEAILGKLPAWTTRKKRHEVGWNETVKNPDVDAFREKGAGLVAQLAGICIRLAMDTAVMRLRKEDDAFGDAFAQVAGLAGKGRRDANAIEQYLRGLPVIIAKLPVEKAPPVVEKPKGKPKKDVN